MRTRYFSNHYGSWCIRCEPGKRPVRILSGTRDEERAQGADLEHYVKRAREGFCNWHEIDGPFGRRIRLGANPHRHMLLMEQ